MKNCNAIITLCIARGINSSLMTYVYPFIAALLLSLGLDQHKVPKYSGLAEGLMALTNVLTIPIWARFTEYASHRNLLIISLFAGSIVTNMFGWPTKVWQILFLRGLLGAVEKMGLLENIIMGDIAAVEDRTKAFVWSGSGDFIRDALGVWLGGYLAAPDDRVPLLGKIALFKTHPFVLPSMVISSLCLMVIIAVFVYIPKGGEDIAIAQNYEVVALLPEDPIVPTEFSYGTLLSKKLYIHLLLTNFFHKTSFYGTLALLSAAGHLPTAIGGMQLSVVDLGHLLGLAQLLSVLYLIFGYSGLVDKLSNRALCVVISCGWVLSSLFFPLANWVFSSTASRPARLAVMAIWVVSRPLGVGIFPTIQLFRATMYPDQNQATKAVALTSMTNQIASVFGSVFYGWIFGVSSQCPAGSLGRALSPFFVLACSCICLVLALTQQQITSSKSPTGRVSSDEHSPLLVSGERVDGL